MANKINISLRELKLVNAGMGVYADELTRRLMAFNDLEIVGTASWKGQLRPRYEPAEYGYFNFPVRLARLPDWILYDFSVSAKHRFVRNPLRPLLRTSYNFLARDTQSDVFLFFGNLAPDFPIQGKVITCIHDISPIRTGWPSWYQTYRQGVENAIEKSTKVITVSEFSKQDIIDYAHIDASRIDVVYNGVNAEQFGQPHPAQDQIRAKYNLPEKYILYFGTCGPRKNVESLIRAYARLPEAARREYALVITNPTDAVKACAEENHVAPCYISNVSTEDKPAVYQMASLLVWLSLYEGFGLPIVEAMAAGVPVVCSNVTSLPEVAGDAAALVGPKDIDEIAAAMERCLYDEPFRQTLIARGYENIKRFSWDASAKKLHDIILSL